MNNLHKLSLLSFIGGFIFFLIGALAGEVEVGFFLIFPFLVGSGIIPTFGIILIFISILLFIFGFAIREDYFNEQSKRTGEIKDKKIIRGGGVILIGPIPIIFGSNWKITIIMMILAVLIILFYFLFFNFFL